MDPQGPAVTFVSELPLIVDFMDDNDLLDHDEDLEKELATISLEVSLPVSVFRCETLGAAYLGRKMNQSQNKDLNPQTREPYHELLVSKFQIILQSF